MSRTLAQIKIAALAAGTLAKQSSLQNVISNTDPAALDSLSEVVSAFQAADETINGAITSLANAASADSAAALAAAQVAQADATTAIANAATAQSAADAAQAAVEAETLRATGVEADITATLDAVIPA